MKDRKSIRPGGDMASHAAGDSVAAIYTSHPIARLKLGRFQFEQGVLRLNAEDAAEFDAQMKCRPISTQNRVKKSTKAAAEEIAKQHLASRMIKGVDTTANTVAPPGGPGSTLNPHANPLHPGASKDKETDGSAEPEMGPTLDKIDSTDGDAERKIERNTPVQESLQASVGGTTGSDPNATGASVAEEETAKNEATPTPPATQESQDAAERAAATPAKPLFGIGKVDSDTDNNGDDKKIND